MYILLILSPPTFTFKGEILVQNIVLVLWLMTHKDQGVFPWDFKYQVFPTVALCTEIETVLLIVVMSLFSERSSSKHPADEVVYVRFRFLRSCLQKSHHHHPEQRPR